ncbi:MAG: YtxH domain-containing protein [Anaerolineaceae bacterium]|nr:YtxH domain-containing protein [Anaerolineaceae bacterium]
MSERSGYGSFFAGFLAGAVAGAIATVLYAPNSGEETRNTLKEKKDEILGKANISVDDAYKQAETAAREARDRFEALANSTRQRAEDLTRRGQVILEEHISSLKKSVEPGPEPEIEEILMPEEAPAEKSVDSDEAETPTVED